MSKKLQQNNQDSTPSSHVSATDAHSKGMNRNTAGNDTKGTQNAKQSMQSIKGSVGASLKSAREKKGLDIAKVADDLNILSRHLSAIEREDYDNLPQKAFTRGFIGSYAKYLKLDSVSILSDFDATYPCQNGANGQSLLATSVSNPIKPMGRLSRNSARKIRFGKIGSLLALLSLAALAFLYFTSTKNNDGTSEVRGSGETTTIVDSMAVEDMQAYDEAGIQSLQNSEVANLDSQSDAARTNDAVNATQETQEQILADPNAAPAELVFWVRREANITITDQTGATIMSGTKGRGEHKAVGKPPFKLTIDQGKNVALNMDKVPQNQKIRKHTAADGSVNFTLTK